MTIWIIFCILKTINLKNLKNNFFERRFRVVIRFTLPVPLEEISSYVKKISELPPLPEYITKIGPFINNGEGDKNRIITLYDFDESRLIEAWDIIFKQVHIFRDFPGFTFSAHRRFCLDKMKDTQSIRLKKRDFLTLTKMRCNWLHFFSSFLCLESLNMRRIPGKFSLKVLLRGEVLDLTLIR